jgi:hypothetical protein
MEISYLYYQYKTLRFFISSIAVLIKYLLSLLKYIIFYIHRSFGVIKKYIFMKAIILLYVNHFGQNSGYCSEVTFLLV